MPTADGLLCGAPAGSMRTNTLRAGRPAGSSTRPPSASWASAFAVAFGSPEADFGTPVPAPGILPSSSHDSPVGPPFASLSFAVLPFIPATPAGNLSSPLSADLHPASASTAAIRMAPAALMASVLANPHNRNAVARKNYTP